MRLPLLDTKDEAREARAQKRFLDFVRNGKGLVGVHAATDALYQWPEYGELIGGYFSGHPWHEDVRVKLDDPGHPLLAAFSGQDFNVTDEIYQFRAPYSRDKLRVLLNLDVDKINMDKEGIKREDKDFAVAWIRAFGKGRVFYFSLGHRHEIFWNPSILRCCLDGIQYALGDLSADATPSSQLKDAYLEQSRATAFTAGLENLMEGVAAYTLSGGGSVAGQLDAFVDEHMTDNRACRDALSKGLAAVAANPQATGEGRALACRKLSLVGTDNAVPALAKLVDDKALGNWARYALARIPGAAADTALVDALKRTVGQDRLAVAALVGQRRVQAGVTSLADLVASDKATAVVAAEALGRIGGADAVDALVKLQPGVKGDVRRAVDGALLDCAESARGNGDSALAAKACGMLLSDGTAAHVRGAAFYGRNFVAGEDGLRAAACDADATLAKEARKAIGMLARAEDLPQIVALLAATSGSSALRQLEGIVVKAAATTEDEGLRTAAAVAALKKGDTSVEARCSLLGALGRIGAPSGFAALESAFKDGNAAVRRAAVKAVSEHWPDAVPARALRGVSRNDKDEGCRVLALRGYARMLAMPSKRLLKDTLELYREGLELAKGAQEKRALIAGLGRLAHPEALAFVKPFLKDKDVQGEALLAAISITEGLNGNAMVLAGSVGKGAERNAIDGDLEKRWGTGGAMQPGDWFAVDLGEERTVHAVIMDAAKSRNDYPRGYRIYTSMDGKEWYGPIGAGKGERSPTRVSVLPTKARHVKIAQTGSHERNWWSIYDLQILGE